MTAKLLFSLFLTLFCSLTLPAQTVRMNGYPVQSSTFIEQVKALKTANPKLTPDEWAKAADDLLAKNGINAVISFDLATCDKIKQVRDARKDPSSPIKLNATLKSVEAESASLILPAPQCASDDCGACFVEVPVLQITEKDFVAVVLGQNIKFVLPGNFFVNSVSLADPKNAGGVKKRWLIPFRATPIGITFSENAIFLAFNDPELSDLSLLVFDDGTLQIDTRKAAEDGGFGKMLESSGGSKGKQIKFDRWKNSYLLDYQSPCK